MTTPAQIRAARALLGWTQADLATKANVSTNAINSIERGKADPKLSTVNAIRRAFESAGVDFIGSEGVKLREPAA